MGSEGSKVPKMNKNGRKSPKKKVFKFLGKKIPLIYAFFLQHDSINDLSTFCKSEIFGRNLVFELW